ncbi:ribonuclease P protein subunit p40, putative [Talaromyces stipitatus ATCC 10500]|uniref:Ribonuclease P protein subunit p40, putative n=1 Tax=Talaromyces stipitatus (strain ATCC 10500 / CBS 375.48 / QM 6759 / NRRL 1006) TaxID=441959 RepID=B8LWG3_TALSN|nr:ribonuclease P protein subunit p40, putative [Talaromyces stipitatus ATCC 10500]EED24274.1 ribonuclease P protein subunit p40, putative [Talaromyces stipitatus ATCC 10500]
MLDFAEGASAHEKSYITIGPIPEAVDPQELHSKKAPFSTISHHSLVHTIELILPKDVYTAIWSSIREKLGRPRYIQVIMPLITLLEGDFFNDFVKPGSVLILSEGRPGVDDVFSLEQGILTLQMSRDKYERTGLTGKPIRSGGRKHEKERFAIEIDLRQPSMLHGKKGFERIIWACRNVLNASVTWLLICDAVSQNSLDKAAAALQKYQPRILDCEFEEIAHPVVRVPPLSMDEVRSQSSLAALEDYCNEVSEWLGLVSLQSPRISVDDVIDPYLSRYAVPQSESTQLQSTALVILRWQGVMGSRWINQLLVSYLLQRELRTDRLSVWSALSASAFPRVAVENKDGYTILSLRESAETKGSSFVAWEFIGASLST